MREQKVMLVVSICLVLLLAACNIPTPVATQAAATPESATATSAPTETSALATDTVAASTDTPVPQPEASDTPIAGDTPVAGSSGPLTVETMTMQEETETPPAIIDLKYPAFTDSSGNTVAGLNQAVQELVDRQVDSFQAMAAQSTPPPDVQTGPNSLYVDYEVRYNDRGMVSIYFPISTYSQGAAHPLPWSETISYDVNNGRVMQLGDVFQAGTDYLTLLSQRSIEDLKRQDMLHWDDGAQPLPENFKSWNITPEGLQITFDPYQVTAYAAGYQKVVLPWDSLGEVLNPEMPFLSQ